MKATTFIVSLLSLLFLLPGHGRAQKHASEPEPSSTPSPETIRAMSDHVKNMRANSVFHPATPEGVLDAAFLLAMAGAAGQGESATLSQDDIDAKREHMRAIVEPMSLDEIQAALESIIAHEEREPHIEWWPWRYVGQEWRRIGESATLSQDDIDARMEHIRAIVERMSLDEIDAMMEHMRAVRSESRP